MREGTICFLWYEDMCMINGGLWEKRFGEENRNRLSFSFWRFFSFSFFLFFFLFLWVFGTAKIPLFYVHTLFRTFRLSGFFCYKNLSFKTSLRRNVGGF